MKPFFIKKMAAIAIIAVVSQPASAQEAEKNLTPLARAAGEIAYHTHKTAISAGDFAAALNTVSDDVRYVAGSACPAYNPCVGKADFGLRFMNWAMMVRLQMKPITLGIVAGTQVGKVELTWRGLEKYGIERVIGVDHFSVRDGKISSLNFTLGVGDEQTAKFANALAQAAAQSKENK
jgi:hypothetical protein